MPQPIIEDYDIRDIRSMLPPVNASCVLLTRSTHIIDLHPHQLSEEEYHYGDSSWPLFTTYSKIAEKEDNKIVERWQKDAEGIIIFVRPSIFFQLVVRTYEKTT